jgi:biopolymer transport protein ExbD
MKRPRHRRRRGISIPVVSMGDIAFLLIIFFMVCSNFAKEASIDLTLPRTVDVEAIENSTVSVLIDANGHIYVQGQRLADAEAVESELAALMQGRTSTPQRTVLFKCDRNADKNVFEPVIDAIVRSGAVIAAIGDKPTR